MYKYIGIRGHRGAGKQTIAYLLGVALNYLYAHKTFDESFDDIYSDAVKYIKSNADFIQEASFRHVYFESFADTPKILLSMILGIPNEWTYDDIKKDEVYINLKDFSHTNIHTSEELNDLKGQYAVVTASQLFYDRYNCIDSELRPITFSMTKYISLRELIVYFSKYIMQNFLGANVWIKSLEANKMQQEDFFADKTDVFKIFIDAKFSSEISYIKNHNGYIVRIINNDSDKEETEISTELDSDYRYDVTLYSRDDLFTIKESIKNIALNIFNLC